MGYKIGVVIQSRDEAAIGLKRCIDFAERAGGSLHVIDITEPTPGWLVAARRASPSEGERRRELMKHFVSNVTAGRVEVSVAVRSGRRIVELIGEVRDAGLDLVVLVNGDLKESPTTAEAFANRVVRKSPVPVLVLRPLVPGSSGTVIALDISVEAGGSGALIDAIMGQAMTLTREDSSITIVHVLEVPAGLQGSDAELDEISGTTATMLRARLESLVADVGKAGDISVVVRVGKPVAEIAAVVREARPELVVVGTVSRSGPAGLIIGNTAEAMLREVPYSMLAVKPPGFQSPLE